jgi:hypothetical protein
MHISTALSVVLFKFEKLGFYLSRKQQQPVLLPAAALQPKNEQLQNNNAQFNK